MRHGLVMQDIVWPGGSSIPPSGMPARAFLRIATLAEMPYVIYTQPGPQGQCSDHAVKCRIYERDDNKQRFVVSGALVGEALFKNPSHPQSACQAVSPRHYCFTSYRYTTFIAASNPILNDKI